MSVITVKAENIAEIETPPVGYFKIFVDTSDGKMKMKDNNGTVKAIVFDTAGPPVDKNFTQSFSGVSTVVVTHNLGKIPNVIVMDGTTNRPFEVQVEYDAGDINNKLTVSWVSNKSGIVICN